MPQQLAIIGCGAIAAAHAVAAQNGGGCVIAALCDVDGARAGEFGTRFAPQARLFADAEALRRESAPDGVILCTPPATHAALASLFLERGVAVLCEKPLATTVEEACELDELATRCKAVLRTAVKYRFVEGVVAAKACLQSGVIGKVAEVEIAFGAPLAMAGRWQADAAQSGGGVLMDNGPHAVDLARFLVGEVRLVRAKLEYGERHAVEEEAFLELESEGGIAVSIALSWLQTLGEAFLTVKGESGSVSVGWNATVLCRSGKSARQIAPKYDKGRAFARQLEAFVGEIMGRKSGVWRGEDGLRAVEIIAAAYAQCDEKP